MSEPVNTRHNPTVDLSDRQLVAIATLVGSGTQTDAAHAAGVTRQTVNNWINHHYGFIAEVNRLRAERLQTCADRLQDAVAKALELVDTRIDEGDVTIAMGLVKLVRLDHLRTANTRRPLKPSLVRRQLISDAYFELLEDDDPSAVMSSPVDRQAKEALDAGPN